jgi:hypothetical protein
LVWLWLSTFAAARPRRLSGVLLFLLLAYLQVLDEQTYSNHGYLLTLIVGLVTVAHWRPRDGLVSGWPLFLLKTQLTITYVFAALTKLNPAFLSGAVVYANLRPSILALGAPIVSYPSVATLAWISVVLELFLAVALWSARWRRVAMLTGIVLHSAMVLSLADPTLTGLAVFALSCWALYVLFLEDQEVDKLLDTARGLWTRSWASMRHSRSTGSFLP